MSAEVLDSRILELPEFNRYTGGELVGLSGEELELAVRLRCKVDNAFTFDKDVTKYADDAISLEEIKDGYILTSSIADVASQVGIETKQDLKAEERKETDYDRPPSESPEFLFSKERLDRLTLITYEVRPTVNLGVKIGKDFEVVSVGAYRGYVEDPVNVPFRYVNFCTKEGLHAQADNLRMLANLAAVIRTKHLRKAPEDNDGYIKADVVCKIVNKFANSLITSHFKREGIPGLFVHAATEKYTVHPEKGLNIRVNAPMRRYADLVNQRMLIAAVIEGRPAEEWPYTEDGLAQIAKYLNQPVAA